MNQNWLAVASADHVHLGREEGFMQICHGKAAPLSRLKPGDHIVYYSPTRHFRAKEKLQSFTAIGTVLTGDPYQVEMSTDFCPYRRKVKWASACETSILPLLQQLNFTKNRKNWGYQFRYGLIAINEDDMQLIAKSMHTSLDF